MKKKLLLIISALLVIPLSACNLTKTEYKISYDIRSEPANLDPQTASDMASLLVIANTFSGLFTFDENGKAVLDLAESYDVSTDGKTYTFRLRPDITWENGDPLVAEDFVFAFQRLLGNDTNSPHAPQYYCIKNAYEVHNGSQPPTSLGVKAINKSKLEIQLATPNNSLPVLLAQTAAMPCNTKFFYETHGKYGLEPTAVLSNGAYVLKGWKHNSYVSLKQNNKYHASMDGAPTNVTLWIYTDKTTGDTTLPSSPVERLLEEKTMSTIVSGLDIDQLNDKPFNANPFHNSVYAITFNQKNKLLAIDSLRKAVAAAFDVTSYADMLHDNHSVARALIPHSVMVGTQNFREYAGDDVAIKYDTEMAGVLYKAALAEMGKISMPTFKMIIPASDSFSSAGYVSFPSQIIQKELGIFISIEELPPDDYKKRLRSGDFDLAMVEFSSTDGSARSILESFYSQSPRNYFAYNSPVFDKLLIEALNKPQDTASNSIKIAEEMLIQDAVAIPMYYQTDYLVSVKSIQGFAKNPTTGLIPFKNVSLD